MVQKVDFLNLKIVLHHTAAVGGRQQRFSTLSLVLIYDVGGEDDTR
jgi:hypothetical protein